MKITLKINSLGLERGFNMRKSNKVYGVKIDKLIKDCEKEYDVVHRGYGMKQQEKMDCNTIYTSIYTGDKTVSISITTGKHLPTIEFGKNSRMVDGLHNQREIVEKILEYLTN